MSVAFAFLLGVAVAGVALPALNWGRKRVLRHRSSATLEDNQVTTVSQVLHLAIQGSPTGVTVLDRSGEIILSNSRAHEMNLVHDRTVNEKVWKVAGEVYADKESRTLDLSVSKRRTGNSVSSVRALIKPLTLVDDRFVIVYSTDESENVRMESARRDFVANVSHELKTPVGGMALLAEALMEAVDDPEHVRYFGQRLHKEAHRMASMINELISLSKLQGAEALPEMEPVSVDDVISESLSRNQVAADTAGITLARGENSGVFVLGDKSLLVTAISNLISNAINYSPQSVPVSVSQKVKGNDVLLIRVTDRGIGISPEDQKRVFERFFRVDKARSRSTGGTGLGLAIVKHVIANHNGNIKLWSRIGTGSTFTLELPIYHPELAAESSAVVVDEEPVPTGPLRQAVSRVATRRKDKS
ncbi:sensor histidine kinase [Corynebacterium alimapuense]|uniref:Sensor-like histidine kinase SenX3 n=1 Tax=Corynebacterium alimapuense TaxID=1576874 RepID=A0A3M8K731_9CORY|nr:ATP-binding protein [Corynebacterium alimapuense]RNE48966.1 two-component sensor histidine kinase [Corynebacterium alimapuense]